MNKIFLEYNQVRDNAISLAHKIYKDGFIPDVIYVLLRGGAFMGNIISECFTIKATTPRYAAVVSQSYLGMNQVSQVQIQGWTLHPEMLAATDKILLVDDIFDSGKTINIVAQEILNHGIARENLKIAVHDYKIKHFCSHQPKLSLRPDYYCEKHEINTESEDRWIHYLSHELCDLTPQEKKKWYIDKNPKLEGCLD